jgi:hypothetical protein
MPTNTQGRFLVVVCLTLLVSHPSYSEPASTSTRDEAVQKVKVRHLDKLANGWGVAQTTHFRVYHHQAPALAEKAAIAAERARTAAYRKWLDDTDADWDRRCRVYVHATAKDYSDATGAPVHSPGHSTATCEGGCVTLRRIDLRADNDNMISAVLPHEVSHVVLAGQFGERAPPRWADEGMAILGEPRAVIDRHLRDLPRFRRKCGLYSARDLVQLKDYPEPRYIGLFYAQSVSLVEFLAKEKGPRTVTRFIREGLKKGYEAALKHHFGWDFDELDRRWRKHAFKE